MVKNYNVAEYPVEEFRAENKFDVGYSVITPRLPIPHPHFLN
jgi:hypothetical protein